MQRVHVFTLHSHQAIAAAIAGHDSLTARAAERDYLAGCNTQSVFANGLTVQRQWRLCVGPARLVTWKVIQALASISMKKIVGHTLMQLL